MSLSHFAARSMLSSIFVTGGAAEVSHASDLSGALTGLVRRAPQPIRKAVESVGPQTLVKVNGVTMTAAGAALALGIKPRCAATVLAAQLVPVTLAGHAFWDKPDQDKPGERIAFTKNLALIGGLLCVALGGATAKD